MENFHDIYDFVYIPFWKTKTFATILIVTTLIVLAILAGYFYKKWAKKNHKSLTPSQWILQELEKISPKKYSTNKVSPSMRDEFKIFYFTLTRLLKEFAQKQIKVSDSPEKREFVSLTQGSAFDTNFAMQNSLTTNGLFIKSAKKPSSMTDDEFYNFLENNRDQNLAQLAPFNKESIILIKRILNGSLHIKFANAQALQDQAKKDFDDLIKTIKASIPQETVRQNNLGHHLPCRGAKRD